MKYERKDENENLIQLHLDCLKGIHAHDVVTIVNHSLFVVEGRKPHALEVLQAGHK